jgi:hypothetical protein
MRFMILVKADQNSEAGILPSRELLTEMGKFNEELVKAGVMLAGEGPRGRITRRRRGGRRSGTWGTWRCRAMRGHRRRY